jgi:hypothetical protein
VYTIFLFFESFQISSNVRNLKRVPLLNCHVDHDRPSVVCPLPRHQDFRPEIGSFWALSGGQLPRLSLSNSPRQWPPMQWHFGCIPSRFHPLHVGVRSIILSNLTNFLPDHLSGAPSIELIDLVILSLILFSPKASLSS